MERIGQQVRLPLGTAFQISLQGIRIRLGRALVTLSGVVLGIAFLMSVFTGNLVTHAVAQEQDVQQKVTVMNNTVRSLVGTLDGKTVSIAVVGNLGRVDRLFLDKLFAAKPKAVLGYQLQHDGVTQTDLAQLGKGSSLVMILGDGKDVPIAFDALKQGMIQNAIVDTNSDRTFNNATGTRDLFFGDKASQQRVAEEQAKTEQNNKARTRWIIVISLLVTVIGISNALLMSVTERFKEIGTMKCLGALSSFIRQLFLIESALIGIVGSIIGVLVGALFPILIYGMTFQFNTVLASLDYRGLGMESLLCLGVGTLLSIVAAIYPANFASRMVPAMALRSNV